MIAQPANRTHSPTKLSRSRLGRAWADLSLRARLFLFAVGLVTLPGLAFALLAFTATREALEREVGIQLRQTAERGADAVAAALEKAQSDARSWARQEVMRDLVVGDLDKRVSRFLQAVAAGEAAYLAVWCTDAGGRIVAASSGRFIGLVADPNLQPAEGIDVAGPIDSPALGQVLAIGVPIADPDPPGAPIGQLILVYDWRAVTSLLDDIRLKLAGLGKDVAGLVVDAAGGVLGGVDFAGAAASRSELASVTWTALPASGYESRRLRSADGGPLEVLVGVAQVPGAARGWSVLFLERTLQALAPVRTVRNRWAFIIASILLIGLAVAGLLARQVMRPLNEVTRATSRIAAQPDRMQPPLPVRSRNEVGQLTESFNKMTSALGQAREEALTAAKFAFAGELAAMVAHEVRTPLSVMRSSAQMLADQASARTPADAELAETIVAEVDRVERVVTGLIQLARPLEQRPEPTSLDDVLSRAVRFVSGQAGRRGIHLECEAGDGDHTALCDPEQMYQVVLNLVVNALQALSPGGRIWLRALPADADSVGFEVGDDGPGLPVAIRDRLFEPFVSGREGGTGLGLAFVQRIVEAHRGTVVAHSEDGRGTRFAVRLPRAAGRA